MSARKRRRRQAVKPAAVRVQAAAKPLNVSKSSASAALPARLALPRQLGDRLDQIEARLDAVEQLTICPMACRGKACPTACPIEGGEHGAP